MSVFSKKVDNQKKFIFSMLCSVLLGLMLAAPISKVKALYYSDSWYNNRAYNWTYLAPATTSYNCLGWALGTNAWVWPWNATAFEIQVTTTFNMLGYNAALPYSPYLNGIIAYSKNGVVTHFALKINGPENSAKWGSLEKFKHSTIDPYKALSGYGSAYAVYIK